MQNVLRMATRTLVHCRVCGSREVRTDEVVDRGLLLLAECPRCQHRWTEDVTPALPAPEQLRPALAVRREAATAA